MQMKVEHVVTVSVTLSEAAVTILKLAAVGQAVSIFPGFKGKPLSDLTLTQIMGSNYGLKLWAQVMRAGKQPETAHGFRSALRDWAAEKMPTVPAMVAEMALAHKVGVA